jgi:sugar/nucleoside kinase (ribokinase family)
LSTELASPGGGLDLCVVGNLVLDLIIKGVPSLPSWGQEVLGTGRSADVGGQGANLARAAARLGLSTTIVSVVGDDESGRRIRDALQADGVGTGTLEVVDGDTALTVAAVRADGERAFLTDVGCSGEMRPEMLARRWPLVRGARAVAFVGTSNLPGLDAASVSSALAEVRAAGGLSVFDPGWSADYGRTALREMDRILGVSELFLPNRDEAHAMTGENRLADMLRALHDRCPGTVIVKCGSEGSAFLHEGAMAVVEALPVHVDSAVGAGDVFDAGVISGLLETGDPLSAAIRGTAAASLYLSRAAARFATIHDWRRVAPKVTVRRR